MPKFTDDVEKKRQELTYKQRSIVFDEAGSGAVPILRVAGEGIFETHRLDPGRELVLGRSEDADVRIDDSRTSRLHARLRTGPPISIEDLGSSNGTKVGSRLLSPGEIVEVAPGEVIAVGGAMLVVLPPGSEVAQVARPEARAPMPTTPLVEPSAPLVVQAPAMVELYRLVDRVAASSISVLLLGETGVGKEMMAEAIHARSPRASKPLLRLNCAALSETLLESELFGHERGAFTGAAQAKQGLLETAHEGTVFLDEAGELPMSLQVKLLRVLEERSVMRVGGLRPRPIDVRFISATNRDLESEVERNAFRRDLYFRLNGISITIPPLRERVAEIEGLAQAFLAQTSQRFGRGAPLRLSAEALARLKAHAWPGNIRELRNAVERAAILCVGDAITPEHLLIERATAVPSPRGVETMIPPPAETSARRAEPPAASDDGRASQAPALLRDDVEAVERRRIIEALDQCAGNQTQAARLLGISRGTLIARIDQYGLPRPRRRRSEP